MVRITRRVDFAAELLRLQPSLATAGLDKVLDVAFTSDTRDIFNLANRPSIVSGIAETLSHLHAVPGIARGCCAMIFKNLTQESTAAGYLAQVQGYHWLFAQDAVFEPEIAHPATLRGRTIDLDGRLNGLGRPIFFDIKSFGFEPDLRATFTRRLEARLPGYTVTIDGPGNHGPEAVNAEAFLQLKQHVAALGSADSIEIPALQWRVRKHKKGPGVRTAEHQYDPVALAHENRWVPLRYASQFTTDAPYILFFVLPDGIGSSPLKINVFDSLRDMAQGIATHMFGPAASDNSPASAHDNSLSGNVTVSRAVARLSGLAFISPQAKFAVVHLNAGADEPLSRAEAAKLARGWEIVVHRRERVLAPAGETVGTAASPRRARK